MQRRDCGILNRRNLALLFFWPYNISYLHGLLADFLSNSHNLEDRIFMNVFNYKAFFEDIKNVLIRPSDYFSRLPLNGGFTDPVLKASIYSIAASVVTVFLPSAVVGATSGIITSSVGIFDLIQFIVYSMVGLFAGATIILALSSICNGNLNFEASFRVASSLFVLCPVIVIIAFIFLKSQLFGTIILLAVVFYGFWMLYLALVKALNAREVMARRIIITLAVLPALVIITSFVREKITTGTFNEIQMDTPVHVEENINKDLPVDTKIGEDQPEEQNISPDFLNSDSLKVNPEETGKSSQD